MRSARSLAFVAVAAAIITACTDHRPDATGPRAIRGAQGSVTMGACTTIAQLNSLAAAVFGAGSPNVNSVLGKLDNLAKDVAAGDVVDAQAQANNIVSFVQQKAAQGTLPGTQADITAFISGVLCYAGLSPDTFLILPSDAPQVRIASDGQSGVSLQGNTVDTPTLLTINTLDPNGPSPLITKLDQYPTYIDIQVSSSITKPAVVAVCPSANVPASVLPHLRVGHQATAGFEVTPLADGSFLTCSTSTAQSRVPAWLRSVANLVLPKSAYAAAFESGGIGGSITEFSPFGAVDTDLSFSGGIGGSITEFNRKPADSTKLTPKAPNRAPAFDVTPKSQKLGAAGTPTASGATTTTSGRALVVVDGVCTEVSATVGTELEAECRPVVTLTTHNGTILTNVPVNWAVISGGGTIAADLIAAQTCGTFGTTAATATDTSGKAGVCWTMGPEGGQNSANATPTAGGDAPAGVVFSPAALTFTATALKITPTATATGGTFTFDNLPHAGSGTCSNSLTPALSYSSGTPPVSVGSYSLTATCGDGSAVYNTVTATANITIVAAVPTVAVSCPDSVVFDGTAKTPCSATATAPGLSITPTPTYANNVNTGTATATVNLAATGNYAAATGSATFRIAAAYTATTVTCPASVTFTGAPLTPCSAAATGPGGLNAAVTPVSYSSNVNAGTATASASYAGGGNYRASSGSSTFTIAKRGATATAGDATINFGAAVPAIPCTVTGLLAADAGSVTCTTSATYTSAGTFPTTPVVSPANPANYAVASVNGTLTVLGYVQQGCFSSPIYSVMPDSKSAQRKGSNLPVKCTLTTPQGAAVTTATGNIEVVDVGTSAVTPPTTTGTTVFTATNVFRYSNSGNYAYGLDTSPAYFVSGHYYYVKAHWNDGSMTSGWFLIK